MATDVEQAAPTLHFSTDNLPATGRASAIREFLEVLMRVDLSSLDDANGPIPYLARVRELDGATWGTARATSIMTRRTPQLLKDAQDDLMLLIPEKELVIRTPGREDQLIRPGDGLLLSYAREMRLTIQGTGRMRAIRVPHRSIAASAPQIGSAPVSVLHRDTPMLSLLNQYSALLENEPLVGRTAQRMAVRHLQDMIALVVGASGDSRDEAEQTSAAAVRLATVRAEIARNLGNTNLGIRGIASQQQVSPRHLQRLFAQEGTSFSDVLRQARVARARALLENPSNRNRTILSIALECGFPEASALNRAFRQEFGLTPSEVRWRG